MASQTSGHLRRVLGVGFGLAVSIGGTIGVGILRTPGLVAGQLHVTSLIVFLWLAGGIYTLLGESCLTELGLMLPRAGGFYVYVRRDFGNTAGFAVGWTDWLMYCSILGYLSIAIAGFITALQAIVITYGGWQSPLYFIEEDREPVRDLPRTMIGGVLSVIGIYLLVNIALLNVLPISELSGATFPAADAVRVIAGAHG